jgi:hypothetical protein
VGIYSHLLTDQRGLYELHRAMSALRGVMKESVADFDHLYAKHYEAEDRGPIPKENETATQLISELLARLKAGMH